MPYEQNISSKVNLIYRKTITRFVMQRKYWGTRHAALGVSCNSRHALVPGKLLPWE